MTLRVRHLVTPSLITVSLLLASGPIPLRAQTAQEKAEKDKQEKARLEKALAALPHPQSVADFTALPHLSVRNQDQSWICWSFAMSSFLETEMKRTGREPMRLSVIYPEYCMFLEKAKRFVATKGESRFAPGELFSGVLETARLYGEMPAAAYEGEKLGGIQYSQMPLYDEVENFAQRIKKEGTWDEALVLKQFREILDRHLGAPPAKFVYNHKDYTPKTFLNEVVNLPLDKYVLVTSFQYAPFNQFTELKVPDNWRHNANFFNVPLDLFAQSVKNAVSRGYSVAMDIDFTEPGYELTKRYAFVPEYQVPKAGLTQAKREEGFASGDTTDDHLIQILACKKFGTEDWILAKDSWPTAWEEGSLRGYFFLHDSYIRTKVLAFLTHRDAIPEITALLPK